jgi:hypothetical protein
VRWTPPFTGDTPQRNIAPVEADKPNAGAWDMITVNETVPHKARFLFSPFETGAGGIQRHDLETGGTDTIWQSWSGYPATRTDPSYWTPWGTYIAGERDSAACRRKAMAPSLAQPAPSPGCRSRTPAARHCLVAAQSPLL